MRFGWRIVGKSRTVWVLSDSGMFYTSARASEPLWRDAKGQGIGWLPLWRRDTCLVHQPTGDCSGKQNAGDARAGMCSGADKVEVLDLA